MFKSNKHTYFPHWVEAEDWLNREHTSPGHTWNVYNQGSAIVVRYSADDSSWHLNGRIGHEYFKDLVTENDFDIAMHILVNRIALTKPIMKGMAI